jgi:cell wall-associated NlpC family hydrolase
VANALAGPPSGAEIAGYAKQWVGTPYVWGGYKPKPGWDCSGFVNYVLGHHFGMSLPMGMKYTGRGHGPTAVMYKTWGKAKTVSSAEAGDLCVWATHIGIALGSKTMVSALDQQLGTRVSGIAGPGGEPLSIRRIDTLSASVPGGGANVATGCAPAALLLPYLYLKGLMAGDWHGHATEGR